MNEDDGLLIWIVAVGFGILICLCTPVAFLDGTAKSAFLKQTQGIEIPWYQATFLDVKTDNINATLKTKKEP